MYLQHDVVCPALIGRDVQLAAVRRVLGRARDGSGIVALIVGEAGVGKSRLLRAMTEEARAAGIPIDRVTARAVSSSDETAKSTSRRPSRHRSMYSTFEVLITIVARGASARANEQATRLTSSLEVQAMKRSAPLVPACWIARRLAPFASIVPTS